MFYKDLTSFVIEDKNMLRQEAYQDPLLKNYLNSRNMTLLDITNTIYKLYQQEKNKGVFFYASSKSKLILKEFMHLQVIPQEYGMDIVIKHGSFISRFNRNNTITYKIDLEHDERIIAYYDINKRVLLFAKVNHKYTKNRLPIDCKDDFLQEEIVSSVADYIFLIYTNRGSRYKERFQEIKELIRSTYDTPGLHF